jgi:CopG family nickel-responsive transcriptional regulator
MKIIVIKNKLKEIEGSYGKLKSAKCVKHRGLSMASTGYGYILT